MHTYSTDNEFRPKVYGAISLLSYAFTLIVGSLLTLVSQSLTLGIVLGPPSWGLAYKLLLKGYDEHAWNTPLARKTGGTTVSDLNGRWEGWILTSYDGDISEDALHPDDDPTNDWRQLTASLDIDQTWRKINVHFETETSSSDSTGATLLADDGRWPSINYQYRNFPPADAVDGMEMHHGTAHLEHKQQNGEEILEGIFYTGPHRENHGRMMFKKLE